MSKRDTRSRPASGPRTKLKRCANCEVFYLKKYGHTCPPPKEETDGQHTD